MAIIAKYTASFVVADTNIIVDNSSTYHSLGYPGARPPAVQAKATHPFVDAQEPEATKQTRNAKNKQKERANF